MKKSNPLRSERDRLVKEAAARGLKIRRAGRTVKQQVAILTAAIK